jgi:hypothetical protein
MAAYRFHRRLSTINSEYGSSTQVALSGLYQSVVFHQSFLPLFNHFILKQFIISHSREVMSHNITIDHLLRDQIQDHQVPNNTGRYQFYQLTPAKLMASNGSKTTVTGTKCNFNFKEICYNANSNFVSYLFSNLFKHNVNNIYT